MRYVKFFGDKRFGIDKAIANAQFPLHCTYCGKILETAGKGDHVPAKCFLHKPYTTGEETLVTVPSCVKCNNDLSRDEEYVAFAIKFSKYGGNSNEVKQFGNHSTLKNRLINNIQCGFLKDSIVFESNRIERVISKYSYALAKYECAVCIEERPKQLQFRRVDEMTDEQYNKFNEIEVTDGIVPEIGTRICSMIIEEANGASAFIDWKTVQENVFRYIAFVDSGAQVVVRMVFEEMFSVEAKFETI